MGLILTIIILVIIGLFIYAHLKKEEEETDNLETFFANAPGSMLTLSKKELKSPPKGFRKLEFGLFIDEFKTENEGHILEIRPIEVPGYPGYRLDTDDMSIGLTSYKSIGYYFYKKKFFMTRLIYDFSDPTIENEIRRIFTKRYGEPSVFTIPLVSISYHWLWPEAGIIMMNGMIDIYVRDLYEIYDNAIKEHFAKSPNKRPNRKVRQQGMKSQRASARSARSAKRK
jgi:hypothetical protein